MRAPCLLAVVLGSIVPFSGCNSGSYSAVIPVAGGTSITVPLTAEGPPAAEAEGFRVERATISPSKEARELRYEFALIRPAASAVRRIQIEDVSDDVAAPLVDDANPQFSEHTWRGNTEMISADDPRLRWIFQITRSLRVFRFTVTTAEGRRIVLHQVSAYPPVLKQAVRESWGEKY